jgi:cysteine desulfuration protein SufE
MTIEELIENFELLGDWEERYAYLIDLGKKLSGLPEAAKTEENRVHGCQAMVWLKMNPDPTHPDRL